MADPGDDEFAHFIVTIEPWLKQVVIIGGWASRLYRLAPSAQKPNHPPLMTLDVDVAMPTQLKGDHEEIREKLLSRGFQEERIGDDTPPGTHYRLLNAHSGFYAEFLTPLIGSEYGRDGVRKTTRRIAGVVSQQLRYLDLLLQAPWTVDLDRSKGFPFSRAKRVRVANPVSFLAHKILIADKRKPTQQAKDIVYIYDALELFGAQLPKLNEEWNKHIKPSIHRNSSRVIEKAPKSLFGEVRDATREAVLIASQRRLSPEAVRETCYHGLSEIFS